MQNFLHEEKIDCFCKIKSLYTINNLCVVIEIIASYFPYGLKMMSRNTLSEPQPDSASYVKIMPMRVTLYHIFMISAR